jgi:hypothetical protein
MTLQPPALIRRDHQNMTPIFCDAASAAVLMVIPNDPAVG